MKTYLLFIFLLFSILSHSQLKFVNLSTVNPQQKEFYIGIENYIEVIGFNNTKADLKTSISFGQVTSLGNNKYSILVLGDEKSVTFTLKQENKTVFSETFQVKTIPPLL